MSFIQTACVCQPEAQSAAEMASFRRRLVEVEGLRIEGCGEALDLLGGEGVRADLVARADRDVLEEIHSGPPPDHDRVLDEHHRLAARVHHLMADAEEAAVGPAFRERACRARSCGRRARRPGRTGRSHFRLSTPGEPIEALSFSQPSATMRMKSAQVCQPEAASPPSSVSAAARLVEMERLRIELRRERDDLRPRHGDAARREVPALRRNLRNSASAIS